MVDITEATMKGGLGDCLKATLHADNVPTYVGIGTGLIAGNAVGKKLQSWYDNSLDAADVPNKWVQLAARTAGRLGMSGLLCAASGSTEGATKETLQMAAVGSVGFVAVDTIRTFGQDPGAEDPSWIDDYLTLQVPTRRAVRVPQRAVSRVAPRPVTLQRPVALQRPAMESAALQPQGAVTRTASLRV